MRVELKFKDDCARMTAYYLTKKHGKRKISSSILHNPARLAKYLERTIQLLITEAVHEEATKELEQLKINCNDD